MKPYSIISILFIVCACQSTQKKDILFVFHLKQFFLNSIIMRKLNFIFSIIDIKKSLITGVWLEGGGGSLPFPFLKIGKRCPNSGKKCPDDGYLWVQFLIQNTIFIRFQEKSPEIFPCVAFLSRAVDEYFLRIWSHLLKKSLMENFIFYSVLSL